MPLLDAQTRGAQTTPDEWWRHAKIQKMARLRGFKVPPPTAINLEAEPARAFVNWGVWIAECPNINCLGAFEDIWRSRLVFFCMKCGNAQANGLWIPVVMPENQAKIEAKLELLSEVSQRNWSLGDPI